MLAPGEKIITYKLEVYALPRASNSPLLSKNPAGFLRAPIEKETAPPPGYVSRTERHRRKQEEAEAERQKQAQEKAMRKSKEERQETFDANWTSLSESERLQLEDETLATLNAFTLNECRKEKSASRVGPAHAALRTGIAKLLADRRGLDLASVTEPVRELARQTDER